MALNTLLNPARLLRTSGIGVVATALALMALPSTAMAQDGRGGGRWNGGGQSAQAQSGGGNGRSWGGGNRGGGERAAQQPRSDRGGSSAGNRGLERSRSSEAQTAAPQRNWARPSQNDGGARGRVRENNRGNAASVDWSAARAARAAESQRRSEAANAGQQQQWSGRNRSYSDPDRNRSYRDGRRTENRRDRQTSRENWRDGNRDGRWDNDGRRWRDNNNDGWRNNNNRWGNNDGRWNRDWRRDNRYDWYSYRNSNRNTYRLGRYYSPYRNYSYRRLGVGFYLDSLFFGSRYWIDDPWSYRLPSAYGSYRWIRYYDDALLVDIRTGEVIDVINDFFW